MKKWSIGYSGWNRVIVEAETEKDAEEKFWAKGMNDLFDSVVEDIVEVKGEVITKKGGENE
jgi:hypothetical protein